MQLSCDASGVTDSLASRDDLVSFFFVRFQNHSVSVSVQVNITTSLYEYLKKENIRVIDTFVLPVPIKLF